jgi:KDO2-lipid IV(A) lauroyltransferase
MPLATLILSIIPRALGLKIAAILGDLAYFALRSQRAIITCNLTQILGGAASGKLIRRYARKTFHNFACCIVDLLRVPLLRPKDWAALAEFQGCEHLNRALRAGRGAILVTAHLGNWDLAGAFLAALGYPLTAVVEPIGQGVTKTLNRYRGWTGMELVRLGETFEMRRALCRNQFLVLLGDRDLTGTGVRVKFFKRDRYIPLGPAWLALHADTPILTGYMVIAPKRKRRPYLVVIEPPLPIDRSRKDLRSAIISTTRALSERLTRMIQSYPDQWFVFQPEWR